MKEYRIKKEAVPFINEKHATAIYSLDTWEKLGIDPNALEEVESANIRFGFKENNVTSLSGWDEHGSHFHFTIHFPSVKHYEHDKFSKGRITRELMDRIQNEINYYYTQFVNGEENEN
jgi:hypothetical protein